MWKGPPGRTPRRAQAARTKDEVREQQTATKLLSLDLTRKCQLACKQCYNASGVEEHPLRILRSVRRNFCFAGPAEERVDVPILGRERVVSVLRR